MKKSFLVIIAMVVAAVAVMGYTLYLLYNAMQVADVLEEDLAKKEDLQFTTTNGQSHEPKKDAEYSESQSSQEETN